MAFGRMGFCIDDRGGLYNTSRYIIHFKTCRMLFYFVFGALPSLHFDQCLAR